MDNDKTCSFSAVFISMAVYGSVILLVVAFVSFSDGNSMAKGNWDDDEIIGYHFHTYFYQRNTKNTQLAWNFRDAIQREIESGFLKGCRLNRFNTGPVGPHLIGSYETCCNATGLSHATSWFMQNRGKLSVLLHPLTRWEVVDHTDRAMWLGPSLPLDVSALSEDLGDYHDYCLPIPGAVGTTTINPPANGARKSG